MAIQSNFPNINPSLLLDFANVKQLDPRITFTRASTATYYDGVTTAKAEQNLLIQSQDISSSFWLAVGQGVASAPTKTNNYSTAPDGTSTAGRVQFALNGGTTTGDISQLYQSFTTVSALPYTFSVYVKSTDGVSTYDMQLAGASASVNITVTGTWTRVTATSNGGGASTQFQLRIRGGQTPTNNDTADVLVWGFQLEQRSAVSSYTATTTQAITNYIPQLLTAASGISRFTHNPTTDESLGLLIEEARVNLFLRSEEFDNANWTKAGSSVTPNTVISPDGTLDADKLIESTAASQHQVVQNMTATVGVTYATSIYAKKAEIDVITLDFTGALLGTYNLSTGVATLGAGSVNNTVVSASMTSVGNGWYRLVAIWTRVGTTLSSDFRFSLRQNASYTGDGYSGLYIWGAQLEAGAFPTSYIATVASQVARSPDVATMTGTNFSSWFNQGEGSIYADASTYMPISNNANRNDTVSFSDGTANNAIYMGVNSVGAVSSISLYAVTSGTAQVNVTRTLSSSAYRTSYGYKVNDVALIVDAGTVVTDTSVTLPNLDRLSIGSRSGGGTNFQNGTIKKIAYYPLRVTNTNLQALTS